MFTDLHWITTGSDLRLAIAARPRSGDWLEDEIAQWSRGGIRQVVSLLEAHEVQELGLQGEPEACEKEGIIFSSFGIIDRGVPDNMSAAIALAEELANSDSAIVIHCRAGIGRSSIMAAAVLIALGANPTSALVEISRARGLQVPDTELQRRWVMGLKDAN